MKNLTIDQLVYYLTFQKFLKDLCIQDFLLAMVENCKKALDHVLLTDLSKAFDCLLHNHIISKLQGCGFLIQPLKLINRYLTERKQSVKTNYQFSSSGWIS